MHQRQCLSVISVVGLSTPDAALLTTMSRRSNSRRKPVEHLVDAVGDADAACSAQARRPSAADLRAQGVRLVGAVVVVGGDVAARRGQLQRDGAADATGSACDERDFSGQRLRHASVVVLEGHGRRRESGGDPRMRPPAAAPGAATGEFYLKAVLRPLSEVRG